MCIFLPPWEWASRRSSPCHQEAPPVAESALDHLGLDPWEWKLARMNTQWWISNDKYNRNINTICRISHLIEPESILGLFPGCSILAFRLSIRLKKHKSQNIFKGFWKILIIEKDNFQSSAEIVQYRYFGYSKVHLKSTSAAQCKRGQCRSRLQRQINQRPVAGVDILLWPGVDISMQEDFSKSYYASLRLQPP